MNRYLGFLFFAFLVIVLVVVFTKAVVDTQIYDKHTYFSSQSCQLILSEIDQCFDRITEYTDNPNGRPFTSDATFESNVARLDFTVKEILRKSPEDSKNIWMDHYQIVPLTKHIGVSVDVPESEFIINVFNNKMQKREDSGKIAYYIKVVRI